MGTQVIETTSFCYFNNLLLQRPYEVKLTNLTAYSLNENVYVNATINNSYINSYISLKETVPDMHMRLEVYVDEGDGKYELVFMNRTISACRIFRDRRYEPIVQVIYKIILSYGNLPRSCPIQKVLLVMSFR